MMTLFWTQFTALFKKETLLASRNRDSVISIFFFSFLVLLVFNFSMSLGTKMSLPVTSALIWLATLFGGMLRINQTFEAEQEGRVFEALRLIPGVAAPFYLSKFLGNLVFLLLLEMVVFGLSVILFDLPAPLLYAKMAWLPFGLGAIGFASVGTLFSAMTVVHGRRDIMLPIILYPILVPLILGAVKSLVYGASGQLIEIDRTWLTILIVFDVIYVTLSVLLFEAVMEVDR